MTKELQLIKQSNGSVVLKAKEGVRIPDVSQLKIGEACVKCCVMLGLELPNEDERGILVGFIKLNLKLYTAEEMMLAFEAFTANKFGLGGMNGRGSIQSYGKFSCAFVMDVMTAYKEWSDKSVNQEKRSAFKTVAVDNSEKNQAEMYEWIDSWCSRKAMLPQAGPWTCAYNHALREGIMSPTPAELEDWKGRTERIIKIEARDEKDAQQYFKDYEKEETFENKLKKEYIKNYFKTLHGL